MASTTERRIASLPVVALKTPSGISGLSVVENFAMFIDTHRDQPHVGTFNADIHRGWCRPTLVHYLKPTPSTPLGLILMAEDASKAIAVDPKHRFVTTDWWDSFIISHIIEHGDSPLAPAGSEQAGNMPTRLLRDARTKVYELKSLRQIVRDYQAKVSK